MFNFGRPIVKCNPYQKILAKPAQHETVALIDIKNCSRISCFELDLTAAACEQLQLSVASGGSRSSDLGTFGDQPMYAMRRRVRMVRRRWRWSGWPLQRSARAAWPWRALHVVARGDMKPILNEKDHNIFTTT